MTRPSEHSLIARYFAPLAGEGGLGLRDDAARLSPRPGFDLVLTADALVSGGHFFADDPPSSIARKALAVNLSDLAAKGAAPVGFLLCLALPADFTGEWLGAFAAGLGEAARGWNCPLLGGDTVKASGGLTLSITALGEVPTGRMVRRTAARPGDVLCVTGTIGDAALGLDVRAGKLGDLPPEHRAHLLDRYLHPQPRIALGAALREHARAAMDVSDGLAGDIAKMMRASGATAIVDAESVPLSPAAQATLAAHPGLVDRVLTGGDDYEILCAVAAEGVEPLQEAGAALGVAVTPVGQVVAGEGLPVFVAAAIERRYEEGSYSHF
jgi:thiamine-monophosphate kinase